MFLDNIKELFTKKPKQDPRILAAKAINGLKDSSEELKSTVNTYQGLCIEAIEEGNEESAEELMLIMADMTDFASELGAFSRQLRAEVIMLLSLSDLNKLGGALNSCIKLINSSGDYNKVRASFTAFRNNLGQGRAALQELRNELKTRINPDRPFDDPRVLGADSTRAANNETLNKIRDSVQAELVKRNLESKLNPAQAVSENSSKANFASGVADIESIDRIIDEERRGDA